MWLEVRCGPWQSDRWGGPQRAFSRAVVTDEGWKLAINAELVLATESGLGPRPMPGSKERAIRPDRRTEEHTSELQSLMRNSYAGLCWKKKQTNNINITR